MLSGVRPGTGVIILLTGVHGIPISSITTTGIIIIGITTITVIIVAGIITATRGGIIVTIISRDGDTGRTHTITGITVVISEPHTIALICFAMAQIITEKNIPILRVTIRKCLR